MNRFQIARMNSAAMLMASAAAERAEARANQVNPARKPQAQLTKNQAKAQRRRERK